MSLQGIKAIIIQPMGHSAKYDTKNIPKICVLDAPLMPRDHNKPMKILKEEGRSS